MIQSAKDFVTHMMCGQLLDVVFFISSLSFVTSRRNPKPAVRVCQTCESI